MRSWWLVVALLAGCGSRFKLDARKVSRVRVVLADRGDTYCPRLGLLPEVVAIVETTDGKVLETWSPANPSGKLQAREFTWSTDVGPVEKNGVIDMTHDLLSWHDRPFMVRALLPARAELTAEQRITPRFDCEVVADVSGIDDDSTTASGDGAPGGHAPRVEVALAWVDTKLNGRLVLARVRDRDLGRWEYFLIDRRSGRRLSIDASGGDGAAARSGVRGANGASGTRSLDGATGGLCQNGQDGAPGSAGLAGGDGQPGGRGGDGGRGAIVTVLYPAAFPELLEAVDISVVGGKGGAGGDGGPGGAGGAGGSGGSGGSAGPTSDPTRACTTSAGAAGREGRRGPDGRPGSAGSPGQPGAPGTITTQPSSVRELFGFELARGWRIVE